MALHSRVWSWGTDQAGPVCLCPEAQAPGHARWVRVGLHVHGDAGLFRRPLEDNVAVVRAAAAAGMKAIVMVANDDFVPVEQLQGLAKELGMLIISGAELRYESSSGPHLGFVKGHPELAMAYHPTLPTPMSKPRHESIPNDVLLSNLFEGVHLMEVANGWLKMWDPDPASDYPWDSTKKWDALLSEGLLVWGLATSDSFQGFPGRLPDGTETSPGMLWSELCIGDDQELTEDLLAECLRRGAFVSSSGVAITSITVTGGTVLEVRTANAEQCTVTTNHGELLAAVDGSCISVDVWELIRQRKDLVQTASYVRVTCTAGQGLQMQHAWTQPFWCAAALVLVLNDALMLCVVVDNDADAEHWRWCLWLLFLVHHIASSLPNHPFYYCRLVMDGFSLSRDMRFQMTPDDVRLKYHAGEKHWIERFQATMADRFEMAVCA